jgi:hypothetical protein
MFNRKKAAPIAPVKMVTLLLEPDGGSFEGDNGNQIEARGFSVKTSAGQHLEHTEMGQAVEGIYLFRLAGATHHEGANNLKGDAPREVLAIHQPDNAHDKNAIAILVGGELTGFVPARLAPLMLPYLISADDKQHTHGSVGTVVRTFQLDQSVVGGDVIVVANGYGLTLER